MKVATAIGEDYGQKCPWSNAQLRGKVLINFYEVTKRPAAGRGLQKAKRPAVQMFIKILSVWNLTILHWNCYTFI